VRFRDRLLIVGGLLSIKGIIPFSFLRTKKILENTEIVLDSSISMKEPFADGTKWDAAVHVVKETLSQQVEGRDNLALRLFGGVCGEEGSKLVVNFSQNNVDNVRDALSRARMDGEPTLVAGIIGAIADFDDIDRSEGVVKRIIVITGSDDGCSKSVADYISDRVKDKSISFTFRFIAIGLRPDQLEQLYQIVKVTGGRVIPVDTIQQLNKALSESLESNPDLNNIGVEVAIMNSVIDDLNIVRGKIAGREYSEAENLIKNIRSKFEQLKTSEEIPVTNNDKIEKLYSLTNQNQEIQGHLLILSSNIVEAAKAGSIDLLNYYEKYDQLLSTYNKNTDEMNQILLNVKVDANVASDH